MLVNSTLTLYHKVLDKDTRLEKWIRYNYENVWWHGGKGAGINKGYYDANDVQVRIPYSMNKELDIKNFSIGDILLKGTLEKDILTQQDLSVYETYNITTITNNTFGNSKHIHIGGK